MTAGNQQNPPDLPPSSEDDSRVIHKPQGLSRLISHDALPSMTEDARRSPQYISGGEDEDGITLGRSSLEGKRSGSPMRCVSEFDEIAAASKGCLASETKSEEASAPGCHATLGNAPPQPNPLANASLRTTHIRALRLEAELQPMRMILGRLMAHPVNKKGLFNAPVNAAALGLHDYYQIIERPMDLGTVKSKLYSIAYQSRRQVAEDIRLVFENAMKYNPPKNAVHSAARSLQEFFEELYVAVGGERKTAAASDHADKKSSARRVSFAEIPLSQDHSSRPIEPCASGIVRTVSSDVENSSQLSTTSPASAAGTNRDVQTSSAATANVPVDSADILELPSTHTSPQATRARANATLPLVPAADFKHQRKRRLSLAGNRKAGHSCRSCLGRSCVLCEEGCLALEPTLLLCNGSNCAGARIRKGATYYIAKDGSRQYCQRCFASLPPVLNHTEGEHDSIRYKRDLLKRKNDEEVVEDWLTCDVCQVGVHQVCAMHNKYAHSTGRYLCPNCLEVPPAVGNGDNETQHISNNEKDMYTFVTGSEHPVRLSDVADESFRPGKDVLSADALAETSVSAFIESKIRERLQESCNIPNAEKTIAVRIISDCDRFFHVPEVIRKHFRMPSADGVCNVVSPPKKVNYRSKAISLFQKVDGLDVCIFCMYVQEYEGKDDHDEAHSESLPQSKKRVYIAYLDSVEHFRPRPCRTQVYHELLVSYLASARIRGFESAHIWACPPSRGNSFVFRNHPASQRTPSRERLISWYHDAIARAIDCGVVTDVKSLWESDFSKSLKAIEKESIDDSSPVHVSGKMVCPPLLEGDFWIEEAVRIHSASLSRHLKTKPDGSGTNDAASVQGEGNTWDPCPARQIGSLIVDRIMTHNSSAPFRRPVNAAAMNLKDYHKIITKPMDLGTVYSKCIHGEYHSLKELLDDVKLVFSNAKRFNPAGHFVHNMAMEIEGMFFQELCRVTEKWDSGSGSDDSECWRKFSDMSMSLDMRLDSAPAVTDYDSSSTDENQPSEMDEDAPGDPPPAPSDKAGCTSAVSSSTTLLTKSAGSKSGHKKLELLTGGPEAVSERMAGEDTWMMEKNPLPPKRPSFCKKGSGKRRRSSLTQANDEEPSSKRRRQTWLGEEVGASVRSMRTSFFACSLVATASMSEKEQEKASEFSKYTDCYKVIDEHPTVMSAQIADARHALLEFSQFRNLEFATLRHAKYSTSVLLYHLHNHDAPGVVPTCTSCNKEIVECRWHKVVKVEELRKSPSTKRRPGRSSVAEDKSRCKAEELCSGCHAKHPKKDHFIPMHVSFGS